MLTKTSVRREFPPRAAGRSRSEPDLSLPSTTVDVGYPSPRPPPLRKPYARNGARWSSSSGKAKIIAASVASASTTAPRLTRRFCFMAQKDPEGSDTPSASEVRCKPMSNVW